MFGMQIVILYCVNEIIELRGVLDERGKNRRKLEKIIERDERFFVMF